MGSRAIMAPAKAPHLGTERHKFTLALHSVLRVSMQALTVILILKDHGDWQLAIGFVGQFVLEILSVITSQAAAGKATLPSNRVLLTLVSTSEINQLILCFFSSKIRGFWHWAWLRPDFGGHLSLGGLPNLVVYGLAVYNMTVLGASFRLRLATLSVLAAVRFTFLTYTIRFETDRVFRAGDQLINPPIPALVAANIMLCFVIPLLCSCIPSPSSSPSSPSSSPSGSPSASPSSPRGSKERDEGAFANSKRMPFTMFLSLVVRLTPMAMAIVTSQKDHPDNTEVHMIFRVGFAVELLQCALQASTVYLPAMKELLHPTRGLHFLPVFFFGCLFHVTFSDTAKLFWKWVYFRPHMQGWLCSAHVHQLLVCSVVPTHMNFSITASMLVWGFYFAVQATFFFVVTLSHPGVDPVFGDTLVTHMLPSTTFLLLSLITWVLPVLVGAYFHTGLDPEERAASKIKDYPELREVMKMCASLEEAAVAKSTQAYTAGARSGHVNRLSIKFMDMHMSDLTPSEIDDFSNCLLSAFPSNMGSAGVHIGEGCIHATVDVTQRSPQGGLDENMAISLLDSVITAMPGAQGTVAGFIDGVPFRLENAGRNTAINVFLGAAQIQEHGEEDTDEDGMFSDQDVDADSDVDRPHLESCERVLDVGMESAVLRAKFHNASPADRVVCLAKSVDPRGVMQLIAEAPIHASAGEAVITIPGEALVTPGLLFIRTVRRGEVPELQSQSHLAAVASNLYPLAVVPSIVCQELRGLVTDMGARNGPEAVSTFIEDVGNVYAMDRERCGDDCEDVSRLLEFITMSHCYNLTAQILDRVIKLEIPVPKVLLVNAIVTENERLLDILLSHGGTHQIGADLGSICGITGTTSLHLAAVQANTIFLERMLQVGGAPAYRICCTFRDEQGQTPLSYAARFGHDVDIIHAFAPSPAGVYDAESTNWDDSIARLSLTFKDSRLEAIFLDAFNESQVYYDKLTSAIWIVVQLVCGVKIRPDLVLRGYQSRHLANASCARNWGLMITPLILTSVCLIMESRLPEAWRAVYRNHRDIIVLGFHMTRVILFNVCWVAPACSPTTIEPADRFSTFLLNYVMVITIMEVMCMMGQRTRFSMAFGVYVFTVTLMFGNIIFSYVPDLEAIEREKPFKLLAVPYVMAVVIPSAVMYLMEWRQRVKFVAYRTLVGNCDKKDK